MKWRTQGQQCSRQKRAFEDRGCFENSGRHRCGGIPTGRIWVHWTPQYLGADNKRRKHKWQRTECWGKYRADRRGVEKWTNRRRTKVGQEITGERAGVSREGWRRLQGEKWVDKVNKREWEPYYEEGPSPEKGRREVGLRLRLLGIMGEKCGGKDGECFDNWWKTSTEKWGFSQWWHPFNHTLVLRRGSLDKPCCGAPEYFFLARLWKLNREIRKSRYPKWAFARPRKALLWKRIFSRLYRHWAKFTISAPVTSLGLISNPLNSLICHFLFIKLKFGLCDCAAS